MITQVKERDKIIIPAYRNIQDIQLIIRLEGRGNYTTVYLRDKPNPLMVSRTLKYFEDQFTDFVRISKSSLINPKYIDQVIRGDAKTVSFLLRDGAMLPASRRRIATILDRLARYHARPSA